jgi:hypothetical protein
MAEKFDATRLTVHHASEQNRVTRDIEKARAMASEEARHRAFAGLYEEYKSGPENFGRQHSEIAPEQINLLKRLHDKAISVEYIRRYGELRAEVEGELYDFRNAIREFGDEELIDLKLGLGVACDTGLLLRLVAGYAEEGNYEHAPENMNHWLRLCADLKKLEAIQEEIGRRSQL